MCNDHYHNKEVSTTTAQAITDNICLSANRCVRLSFIDNGILQRRSRVGEKVEADTYILSLNENFSNVRATVQRGLL